MKKSIAEARTQWRVIYTNRIPTWPDWPHVPTVIPAVPGKSEAA